ncbi:MAG: pyridoxamine 5'-phosphate oxidase [Gemmatimonadetes bacterium]|nr:pyridoxamine 5'-phosphate oxidase [Gemmatimonadota bacterium]
MDLAALRQDYARESLSERDVDPDPVRQFEKWIHQAQNAGLIEPNAMALATSTPDGRPSVRMVLLKAVNQNGFVFFTDYRSRKGEELAANPHASLCFWWDALQRQVRVEGSVARASVDESTAYFKSRPHGSRIGAWASVQSAMLNARDALEREVLRFMEKFPEGTDVPLPHHWGGFRLTPETVEFWQGRPSRLHDRIVYRRHPDGWNIGRLSP